VTRRDLLAVLVWLGISVFGVIQSVKSDLGSLHSPGPGFLPFWSAVILGTLSIILLVTNSLKKKWEGTQLNDILAVWLLVSSAFKEAR
jgi:hypothetical protein